MTSFDYAAFVRSWRELCAAHRLNPKTGYALETECVYRTDDRGVRHLARVPILPDPEPALLCDPASETWWARPELWDCGENQSPTEAAAFASIAQQARRAQGIAGARITTLDAIGLVREVMAEMRAERMVQHELPLAELHRRRGVTVEEVAGLRMEVAIKKQVA